MSITELLTDWAPGRNLDTFVHQGTENRVIRTDSNASAASRLISHVKSKKEALKKAYQLCSSRIKTMTKSGAYTLSFDPSKSLTDGKRILVSTEAIDNKKMPVMDGLSVIIGLATHEAAHILYTDFTKKSKSSFTHCILNIIEDERIETLVGHRWPGYADFLSDTKKYYFDFTYKPQLLPTESKEIFDCFFKLVRYPKHLDETLVEKHLDFLSNIKSILTPYPDTFQKAFDAAHKIADLFEEELMNPSNEKGDGNSEQGEQNKNTPVVTPEQAEKLLEKIASQMDALLSPNEQHVPGKPNPANRVNKSAVLNDELTLLDVEGKAEIGSSHTRFIKADPDKTNYKALCSLVKKDARDLSRILKTDTDSVSITQKYLRKGTLDDSKIADFVNGAKNVYLKRQVVDSLNSVNIVLFIDESGSMAGQKIEDAAKCAILIQQAVKLIPVHQLFIYGFTSDLYEDGDNVISIYKEPGFDSVASLGNISSKSCNRDGVCIRQVATRVRTFTKAKTLFFVISDGSPSGNGYYDDFAIEDTKKAVDEITNLRFIPFQIGIGTNPATQQKMFTDFITYSTSSEMVKNIKKTLIKTMRKHLR